MSEQGNTNEIIAGDSRRRARTSKDVSLDEYITSLCMDRTLGEIMRIRETASNVKAYFGATLIFNAVFEHDVGAIEQIAKRVDGGIPDSKERDKFANMVGDAIEDVMAYTSAEQAKVFEDDPCIIAIAKVLLFLSMEPAGRNIQKRKDRQRAIEMVLNRTGGRKSEPVKNVERLEYVEPDWMQSLPSGK